ncbi:hypothetical protein [Enterobacter roggenkampii]|uniref:hypothetical protein n=1 Tax=Enterobacter roggenkampii TaxID=1812935 RepID=UPI002075D821|nr:hypothetical protein [Enterobacter roggenkampii]MCM7330534.1 hypothetical protein [Enterobacter roggenkampii]
MSTITREQLHERAREKVKSLEFAVTQTAFADSRAELEEELELARIALASLEAEAVCVIDQSNLDYLKSGADADVWPASRTEMGDVLLYRTAPPAPANAEPVAWLWSHRKHPSEVTLVRPEDDERAEGAHWSGWSCQALYSAPPAPVSVPDELAGKSFNYIANKFQVSLSEAQWILVGWNARSAAMLQSAGVTEKCRSSENVQEVQEYPETLPCPVFLEPALRFGKGVPTRTMLGALQRRAEYYAELEDMTPEQRAEHDANMNELAAMLQGAEPDFRETSNSSTKHFRENAETSTKCWCRTCRPVTISDMRFVVCPECGNKRCPHANDHRNACTGSNEPGQEGSAYPAAPQQEAQ